MNRIFRLPVLAGGILMAAVLASLAPATSSRVYAQVTVYSHQNGGYYNPYGQGFRDGYGQGLATSSRASRTMFQSHAGLFGSRVGGHSGYGAGPPGDSSRFDYSTGPHVRVYGRTRYHQPSYGPVYMPFGYADY